MKPDPSTLKVITLSTTEGNYPCIFYCADGCGWKGDKVAARRTEADGIIETYCPECLAEAKYEHNN